MKLGLLLILLLVKEASFFIAAVSVGREDHLPPAVEEGTNG